MSRYTSILKKLNKEIESLEAQFEALKCKLDKKKKERNTVQTLEDDPEGGGGGPGLPPPPPPPKP